MPDDITFFQVKSNHADVKYLASVNCISNIMM